MLDVDAHEMLLMIELLYVGRQTVTDYDVLREAQRYHLGRDGERAVRFLRTGRYTKDELKQALTDALLESRAVRTPDVA